MTALTRGANTTVPTGALVVTLGRTAGPDLDVSALLVTGAGKVRSDADFVFYNQPGHASGAVAHTGKQGAADTLGVDLSRVEPDIDKVVVAASIDGGTLREVSGLQVTVAGPSGEALASFEIDGGSETALVAGELYRRGDEWKFRAVGQGYDAGLAGLARDFGISVEDDEATAAPAAPAAPAATTPPATAAPAAPAAQASAPAAGAPVSLKKQKLISLEKQLETTAPALLSLTKTAAISLEKSGLGEHTARVALCLDISGSMAALYRSGKIQQLVERVLAVGVRFDDDGQVDCFLFGTGVHQPPPIGVGNFSTYVADVQRQHRLEAGTKYGAAMQAVREHYFGNPQPRSAPLPAPTPVYVMFVTDGQTQDQALTREQAVASSYEPLFWQFMAIGDAPGAVDQAPPPAPEPSKGKGLFGRRRPTSRPRLRGSDFTFLEELDDMGGRFLDNADFFAVTDPANLSDEQLFDLMTTEYPDWLAQARQRGLVTG